MAHKMQVLAAGLAALVLTLAVVGWGLGAGRSAPATPRPAITPPAPLPTATAAIRVPSTPPTATVAMLPASATAAPAASPRPAGPTVAPSALPVSPTPAPPGALSAAAILSQAAQAARDPRVFGLQSYQGSTVAQSEAGGPGNEWPAQTWFLAPAHRRVALATGETFVFDGARGWLSGAGGTITLIDAAQRGGPASGRLDLPFPLDSAEARLIGRDQVAGRLAYVLELTRGPRAPTPTPKGPTYLRARVWFDSQTYIPLRIEDWDAGALPIFAWRFTSFTANPALDPALFAFAPPVGAFVEYERPPTAAELAVLWAQVAAAVAYPVFRPGRLPAGLVPDVFSGPEATSSGHGWVTEDYHATNPPADASGNVSSLRIIELPAPAGGPGNAGEALPTAEASARYQERPNLRWLVLDRDGTEIWLEGMGAITRDDLLQTAAALMRVAPLATAAPGNLTAAPAGPHDGVGTLRFVDAQHGWFLGECPGAVCARALLVTTDGGQTWQPRRSLPVGALDIAFTTASDGWAFGDALFVTHDGGSTWASGGLPGEVASVDPVGASVWAVAQSCRPDPPTMSETCTSTFQISPDGGRTWRLGPDLTGAAGVSVIRVSRQDAWLETGGSAHPDHADATRLQVTHDGGQTWHALPAPPTARCLQASFAGTPDGHLWLLCASEPGAGSQLKSLYLSTDWGAHWTLVSSNIDHLGQIPGDGYLEAFTVSGPRRAWMALTRGTLYGTTDGGRTWDAAIPADTAEPGDSSIGDVVFADATHGWLITMISLFRTTDGGAHWEPLPHP